MPHLAANSAVFAWLASPDLIPHSAYYSFTSFTPHCLNAPAEDGVVVQEH